MKLLFIKILFLVICTESYAQVASSRDTVFSTDEINVISSRVETELFRSPVSVKVLGEKQISSLNGDRLTDILKSSGSIFLKSYGGNGSLSTISLNGLGAEHTLILIDGKKINSNQNSQVDLNLIPKDKIEKIEIMNNGSSSLYGSNAIGGVINVITKNNRYDRTNASISGSIGSYGFGKYSVNLMNSGDRINLDIFYSGEKSENNFRYYYDDGIKKTEKERSNNKYIADNVYLNFGLRINKRNELRISSGYFSQTRNLPGQETGTPAASSEQRDFNWNNNLSYRYKLNESTTINSDLNYQNNLMKYKETGLFEDFYKNRVLSNNTSLSFKRRNIKGTAGFELAYSDLNGSNYDYTVNRKQYGIFSAFEIDAGNKIKIFPSARYDIIKDIDKSVLTGKIGISFKPFEKINLNLRSSAGNNFSAPTFNELYWQNIGNKDLKPEKSINCDAGMVYKFNFMTENTIELNYTYISLEDKIVWRPAEYGFWRPFNIDKSKSDVLSADFSAKKKIMNDFEIGINYNYTYNKTTKESEDYPGDPSFGKQIFYIPVEMSKINIQAEYYKFTLNIFYSFTGKRYSDFENKNRLPVIDLVDGNMGYEFNAGKIILKTKLEVNNILNEDYQVMQGYPMPLRNYKFNISLIY